MTLSLQQKHKAAPTREGTMAEKRILLLEDEEDVSELYRLGLRSAGYAIDVAKNVAQARQQLAASRFDLVIVDLRLPDGDGLQIADQAADMGSRTCIVSSYLFQTPASLAERHEVLMKPLRPRELVAAVGRLIGPGGP
jgi:two-component system response regulator PilR (NtrC family)